MSKLQRGYIGSFVLIVLGVVLLMALFPLLIGFRTVEAGTVQVVTRFGKVTGKVLHPGANFITPLIEGTLSFDTKKVIYEATAEEKQKTSKADYKDFPVDTNTKDGQQVDIYYTVRFGVDPTKATWIAQNIGSEDALVEKIVKTDSRIWVRNIVREYEANQLYTGNVAEVQKTIEEKLRPIFENNGLLLDEVGIREIKFSDEYVKAIEQKQIQAVNVETQENIAKQAKFQKEARITQAEGQAKEQELQRQTISPELLQKMWIEKWNGSIPQVITSNNASMFLDMSSLKK